MSVLDPALALVRLTIPACAECLVEIRAVIRKAAVECGVSKEDAGDIVVAVDEACQNIVRHAYKESSGMIEVSVFCRNERIIVYLRDFAPAVDIAKIKPRPLDDLRPGGLGVHFMRTIMDEVVYLPPPDGIGNLLVLMKRIKA